MNEIRLCINCRYEAAPVDLFPCNACMFPAAGYKNNHHPKWEPAVVPALDKRGGDPLASTNPFRPVVGPEMTASEVLRRQNAQRRTRLPSDARARKAIPLFSGCLAYFPDALCAVAEVSRIGNEQHNPGKPLHWDRGKSGDELNALSRHLLEAGNVDSDGIRESAKIAWRALANLQKEIEGETK